MAHDDGWSAAVTITFELLDRAETPDGADLTLNRHGRDFVILADGLSLMSSRNHGSEEGLATLGCVDARKHEAPCVLVGGLGLGFTLRATLDALPPDATVVLAELMPAVVRWNRGPLGPLANHPLDDPRVEVVVGDVAHTLARSPGRFDAILLDVDNGPTAFTQDSNGSLYGNAGVENARQALRPGGTLAVWSATENRRFEHRLRHAGFSVRTEPVRARLEAGGPMHYIFLGQLSRSPANSDDGWSD